MLYLCSMKRLCWDYRGPDAAGTAHHFDAHLTTFLQRQNLSHLSHGVDNLSPVLSTVWLMATEEESQRIQVLRPHRTVPVAPH